MLDLDRLLRFAVEQGASDAHVKVGRAPAPARRRRAAGGAVRHRRAGRDRAVRARDHARGARRRVPQHERGRLHVRHHRARALPSQRVPSARLGGTRVPSRAARHSRLRRAVDAACRRRSRRPGARARARLRPRGLREDRDARGDGRPREQHTRMSRHHHRRPGRGVARGQACGGRPARGGNRHAERGVGADARAPSGPRRDHGERDRRRDLGVGGAASGRDRPVGAVEPLDRQRGRHRGTVHRPVPTAPTAPRTRVAGRLPPRRRLATPARRARAAAVACLPSRC